MSNKKTKSIVWTLVVLCVLIGIFFIMKSTVKKDAEGPSYITKPEVEITSGVMTPEALLAFGRLSDPQMSPDGKYILYGVSYNSISENRACRNLFICNADGDKAQQLSFSGKSISNARWSADGKTILYICQGQIWKAKLKGNEGDWKLGKAKLISDVPAGVGEFKLSPDEKSIMYISYVKSHVDKPSDIYQDLDKAQAYVSSDLMYRHWDHWVEEIPHTFVAKFNLNRGKIDNPVDILADADGLYELPTEPFSGLEQLAWSPDSKYIVYSCRKKEGREYAFSTNTGLYAYNVKTAQTFDLKVDGGYDTDPCFSPDGSKLLWIGMERDGYEADKQRLMIADVKADKKSFEISNIYDATSSFKYNVAGPVWDDDSKTIYFNALAEGLQAIFKAELVDGKANFVRITEDDLWYDFNTPFHICRNIDGDTILYTSWCSMDFPTELVSLTITPIESNHAVDLVEGGAHTRRQIIDDKSVYYNIGTRLPAECNIISDVIEIKPITHENEALLNSLAKTQTEARQITTVDGKDMLTWVIYPADFQADKQYNSVMMCMGGPQGTLSQSWSYRWNYRLMAAQGYIVVLPNRRGTTAFGQDWCEQISGDYSGLNIQDYLVAARRLKSEPYINKMAAVGASYGGYSVYYLCGNHGDTFDAFIAHAGIFNFEQMYVTTEESWFTNWDNGGLREFATNNDCPVGPAGDGITFGGIQQAGSPWSNDPRVKRHFNNSPHKFVTNWHTPLLVIHGGLDYRIPVEQGMAAFNAAQMMGVPSKLIVFPEENHWILQPQNAIFWHRQYFDWLNQWL